MDEAATAIDARPFPASPRDSRDSSERRCTYEALVSGKGRGIYLAVWAGGDGQLVYDLRRNVYSMGGGVQDVPGLGDKAFVVKGDDGWINVLKNGVYLTVEMDYESLSPAEANARVTAIARAALGRF